MSAETKVSDIDVNPANDEIQNKAGDESQKSRNETPTSADRNNEEHETFKTGVDAYPSYYDRARYKKRKMGTSNRSNRRLRDDQPIETATSNEESNPEVKEEKKDAEVAVTKAVKPVWMSDEDFRIQQESIQRAIKPVEEEAENTIKTQPMAGEDQNIKMKYLKTIRDDTKDDMVRNFYNTQTFHSRQTKRTESPIYRLRSFNNCIKYILINKYGKPEGSTLELGCGKGGDLAKWGMINTRQFVGIDLSDESIREAIKRYRNGRHKFQAVFATGDAFKTELPEILQEFKPEDVSFLEFDNVSMQFCMHYAFSSEESVNSMMKNVSKSLKVGGMFVGTIPSSDFIRWKLKKLKKEGKFIEGKEVKWENSVYSVTFPDTSCYDFEKDAFSKTFGNVYNYYLQDAVDNVPEYVVPFEKFRAICEENGLVMKYKRNFFDMFSQEIGKYFYQLPGPLVQSLRMPDGRYGVSGDEREACSFYLSFAFEKV